MRLAIKRQRAGILLGLGSLLSGCTSAVEHPSRDTWSQVYETPPATETASTPASASQSSATSFNTLSEVLLYAERHNDGLRAAFDRWTAAHEQVPQSTSLPDPKFSYAYFLEPVETRVGPQRQKFALSQTIPLFGKLGRRGDIAIHNANIAGARFEEERLALRQRVTRLWNDYYYLGRAIAVTRENVRLVTHLEGAALAQYAAGRSTHADALRAQVELSRLEDRLQHLQDQQRALVAGLNAELGRATHLDIAWPDSLEARDPNLTSEWMLQHLQRRNPRLRALYARAARDSAAASLAGRAAIPDLTLGAEYIDIGPARNPQTPDSGKDAAMVMASLNVPLWFGQHRAASAQAQASRTATVHEAAQLHKRLVADFERAHFELRDAERRIALYAFTLVPQARQAFEVTEDAFASGGASFLDLIDTQRTLLEFELAHERARTDRINSMAQLETLIGANLLTPAPEEVQQ